MTSSSTTPTSSSSSGRTPASQNCRPPPLTPSFLRDDNYAACVDAVCGGAARSGVCAEVLAATPALRDRLFRDGHADRLVDAFTAPCSGAVVADAGLVLRAVASAPDFVGPAC